MSNYSMITNKYVHLWNKYRPAILKFMIDSANGPQEYKFSKHEFQQVNPNEKGGHSFILRVFQGRAENNIKTSDVAKDLLVTLNRSKKASELIEDSLYEFTLDKFFNLHIIKEDPPEVIDL